MTRKSWHAHFKKLPPEQRTSRDGIVHDSKTEMIRWEQLKLWQLAGEISDLQRQVKYPLVLPDGTPIMTASGKQKAKYTPDFVYKRNGELVIEDHKGYHDSMSRFRIRVFEAIYKVKVTISH